MNPKWAEENLQTIRTLMERSALYRRALAPIMLFAGVMGIAGGLAGWQFKLESNTCFILIWVGVAVFSLVGALLLVRRQALKDSEPFWSPPTRRVGQALLPAFSVGLTIAVLALINDEPGNFHDDSRQRDLIIWWSLLYGCAVHAAGFFIPRGVRWLGWVYVVTGAIFSVANMRAGEWSVPFSPHILMGLIFGGLHLAYGIYLYFTEKKNPVA